MNPKLKKIFFTIGFPFSPLYSQLMVFRSFLYKKRIFKTHEMKVPVISVGNLTMGGTGKTPLVMYLAKQLFAGGYRPAIVSRGYRGTSDAEFNIVSDGTRVIMEATQCGDEPWLLANELPGVVVATGKNRVVPCHEVIHTYNCNIIILDDGFQHLRISRSIDLVLFDINVFAGNSRVFPGGELREPVSALKRCSALVLTGGTGSNKNRADKCSDILSQRFQDKPLFRFTSSYYRALLYKGFSGGNQRETISLSDLPENLYCFCGIANPQRFKQLLAENGVTISGFKTFIDHHCYTNKDMNSLVRAARNQNAPGLLTTEKDISKVGALWKGELPLFTLPIEFNTNSGFDRFINQQLSEQMTS